jgi:hypothetical protein
MPIIVNKRETLHDICWRLLLHHITEKTCITDINVYSSPQVAVEKLGENHDCITSFTNSKDFVIYLNGINNLNHVFFSAGFVLIECLHK